METGDVEEPDFSVFSHHPCTFDGRCVLDCILNHFVMLHFSHQNQNSKPSSVCAISVMKQHNN